MFLKIRRDNLIVLTLAFLLIASGRVMSYMSFATYTGSDQGVPISGVIVKGNDIISTGSIRSNIAQSGFRSGSYIRGDTLVTGKRELPLSEAIENAKKFATLTTIPGTRLTPIVAADVKVDKEQGIVTVNVIESFSNLEITPPGVNTSTEV